MTDASWIWTESGVYLAPLLAWAVTMLVVVILVTDAIAMAVGLRGLGIIIAAPLLLPVVIMFLGFRIDGRRSRSV